MLSWGSSPGCCCENMCQSSKSCTNTTIAHRVTYTCLHVFSFTISGKADEPMSSDTTPTLVLAARDTLPLFGNPWVLSASAVLERAFCNQELVLPSLTRANAREQPLLLWALGRVTSHPLLPSSTPHWQSLLPLTSLQMLAELPPLLLWLVVQIKTSGRAYAVLRLPVAHPCHIE